MRITNVVVQSSVNLALDLSMLIRLIKDARYQPSSFSALIWKDKRVKSSCLLFANGKIVSQGATSFEQARLRLRQYARLLQRMGAPVTLSPIRIVTITGLSDVGHEIDLHALCKRIENGQYEPELFNAMILRRQGITYSIFTSGKVVITGLKSIALINKSVNPTILELSIL